MYLIEIPHQTTTIGQGYKLSSSCILSKFHIKPQLITVFFVVADSCILSKFHIKPQLSPKGPTSCFVVSYRNSTSNHNTAISNVGKGTLYLIEIPHQTTTIAGNNIAMVGCILSKFHIKPQRDERHGEKQSVVSYRNSTSNHNAVFYITFLVAVVSYRNSTSNHNLFTINCQRFSVVSYRNSTSNHNTLSVIS